MIYHQGIPKFLWYTQVVAMTFNIDLTNCYQSLFYESTTQSLILVIPQEGWPSAEHQTALYLAQSYYRLNGYIPIVRCSSEFHAQYEFSFEGQAFRSWADTEELMNEVCNLIRKRICEIFCLCFLPLKHYTKKHMSINGEEKTQWKPKQSTHCSWSAHAPGLLEIHFCYLKYQVYDIF